MKKSILLNVDEAGGLICELLHSCGNDTCSAAIGKLKSTTGTVPLEEFTDPKTGSFLKPVFGNLQGFAMAEGNTVLGLAEVARYFGGKHHIELMVRKAFRSQLGIEMGLDAGLVLDVLLPLRGGEYRNGPWRLEFANTVEVNPGGDGVPCYHRGLVINIPLEPGVVADILAEQRASKEFAAAVERMSSPVELPAQFIESLQIVRI